MSGYAKQRRKNPRKTKSISREQRVQNDRMRLAEQQQKRDQRVAQRRYEYKMLLMQKSVRELRDLASTYKVNGRGDMNKEQLALGLIQKGWTP